MTKSAVLTALHRQLAWPSPREIFAPTGAGPAVYARLVNQKLAIPIHRLKGGQGAQAGVLMGAPTSDSFDAPIGIVCEFRSAVSQETLRECHKLAWSFCRSPLLVTVEPALLKIWSCYEQPNRPGENFTVTPVYESQLKSGRQSVFDVTAQAIHWVELASGRFVANRPERFERNKRADVLLLANLKYIRHELRKDRPGAEKLPESIAHDLLARLIFIQFLFQRRGRKGKPALHEGVLYSLSARGVLSAEYASLADILRNKSDTYRFFEWLDDKFNGDLFPADWREERSHVSPAHLNMLAEFIRGDMVMENGQRSLWPLYSFDAIPLEFISSIYEEFAKKSDEHDDDAGIGEHYTPTQLVDFLLDKVLPWSGTEYDLKVLDPACGSGVFLVKAFQRLVYRWRSANQGKEPDAAILRSFLEKNIFGVDINERAVRVASFSLYLAMCDEKDPRHYWSQMKFPDLRNVTLRSFDFFLEKGDCLSTINNARQFDLVIGNAPWGEESLTPVAKEWANKFNWDTADEQSGVLFLPKAAALTEEGGRVCMLQSANAMLFNIGTTSSAVRRKLFETYKVHEIVNLSMRRFDTFPGAVSPTCVVILSREPPDGEPIAYWSPKAPRSTDGQRIEIDHQDFNWIFPQEAARDPRVWTALALGGRRDLELVRRLRENSKTLQEAIVDGDWRADRGFQRGIALPQAQKTRKAEVVTCYIRRKHSVRKALELLRGALREYKGYQRTMLVCYREHASILEELTETERSRIVNVVHLKSRARKQEQEQGDVLPDPTAIVDLIVVLGPLKAYRNQLGLPILESISKWKECDVVVRAGDFERNQNPFFEHPREEPAYALPVLLMKESWTIESFRFKCVVVRADDENSRLLYSQSFYGVHAPTEKQLAALAASLNSIVAVYYLYMTSGRLAAYRPTVRKDELLNIPLPGQNDITLAQLSGLNENELDERTLQLYKLNEVERALVRDFFEVTLADFKKGASSPGYSPLRFSRAEGASDLFQYCDFFMRVLQAGFGSDKPICATVTRPDDDTVVPPFYLVAFHLELPGRQRYCEERVPAREYIEKLTALDAESRKLEPDLPSIFYRRDSRIYRAIKVSDQDGRTSLVPTVYIVKPNQRRYWTRSIALRDADETTADILLWNSPAAA